MFWRKREVTFFVTYSAANGNGGRCCIRRRGGIYSIEDVEAIEAAIERDGNAENVCLQSWREFDKR